MISSKTKWWHWLERENIPVVYCNLRDSGHPFDPRFKTFTHTHLRHLFAWDRGVLHVYFRQQDLDNFKSFLIPEVARGGSFVRKLSNRHFKKGMSLINYGKSFEKIDFSKKSDNKLLKYLQGFKKHYYDLALYTYIPVIGTFALEDELIPYLKSRLKDSQKEKSFGECLGILTHHTGKSWNRLEEEYLWKIVKQIRKGAGIENPSIIQKMLNRHTKKFLWLETAYKILDKPLNKGDFAVRLRKLQKTGLSALPTKKEMSKRFRDIMKELKIDSRHARLFKALGQIIYLKEYRDGIYNHSHYHLNFLLQEVATRFSLKHQELFYMRLGEFENLLSVGERANKQALEARRSLFVWICDKGEDYFTGNKARKIINKEVGTLGMIGRQAKEIYGNVASHGIARGTVRVVHSESELDKVRSGDVLVAYMTKPSYLPAMRKATAFVTNEGGITCHAAIVAREMRKPCVIDTKIATQVLKDGDLVEVDANNGVVRIVKRAGN